MGFTTGQSYATLAQFLEFGLPRAALFATSDEVIERQLEASSRAIDSLALQRFAPPLTSWGSDVVQAVCVHAAWNMPIAQGTKHPRYTNEDLKTRYEAWICDPEGRDTAWAERCAKGKATPTNVVDQTPEVPDMSAIGWAEGGDRWQSSEEEGAVLP